jgi:hypothetical protein
MATESSFPMESGGVLVPITELDVLEYLIGEAEERASAILLLVPDVFDGQLRVDGFLHAMAARQAVVEARTTLITARRGR